MGPSSTTGNAQGNREIPALHSADAKWVSGSLNHHSPERSLVYAILKICSLSSNLCQLPLLDEDEALKCSAFLHVLPQNPLLSESRATHTSKHVGARPFLGRAFHMEEPLHLSSGGCISQELLLGSITATEPTEPSAAGAAGALV